MGQLHVILMMTPRAPVTSMMKMLKEVKLKETSFEQRSPGQVIYACAETQIPDLLLNGDLNKLLDSILRQPPLFGCVACPVVRAHLYAAPGLPLCEHPASLWLTCYMTCAFV